MIDRPTVEQLRLGLSEALIDLCGNTDRNAFIAPLDLGNNGDPFQVSDAVSKWLIRDAGDKPKGVALSASPVAPGLVARGMQRAREAKLALGADLGRVILDPLQEGEIFGLSFAVLPYCRPLSRFRWIRRFERSAVGPAVLDWLRQATKRTLQEATEDEVERHFRTPLRHLANHLEMPNVLRDAATVADQRLQECRWKPRHVLMHNDFWDGNVLIDQGDITGRKGAKWRDRFVVIDWPGSVVKGYAFYDLVRWARAVSLSARGLTDEVSVHCQIVGCDAIDAPAHLLTALGHLEMNRERFPLENFIRMAVGCLEALWGVCGKWK